MLTPLFTAPWSLIVIIWLAFFWQLGTPPLYDLDEGAFTESTREMLVSGNFITPHRDGEPRYDKPILIYWLQIAAVKGCGFNELALRLPSAIAATFWVLALWYFVREHCNRATATIAGLILALTLEVGLIGKAAVADALLNLWLAFTLFACYRYYHAATSGLKQRFLWQVYLGMGLGFLTKGPIAIVIPLLVTVLFSLSCRQLRPWREAVLYWRGWVLFLLITLPWHIAVYIDDGSGFFRSFFLHHNLARFGGVIHNHAGFWGYYLIVLPLIILPFSGMVISLIAVWRELWADTFNRFLILWFVTVFVLFSFAQTKLPHYLVYGITPLCILIARYRDLPINRWVAFSLPLLLFGVLAALPIVLHLAPAFISHDPYALALLTDGQQVFGRYYQFATITALLLVIIIANQRSVVWQRLLLIGLVQLVLLSGVVVPHVFAVLQQPIKTAALIARTLNLPTVIYRTSQPSFSVYRHAITPNRLPQPGELVLIRVDRLPRLMTHYTAAQLHPLYQRGGILLMRVQP